MRERASYCRRDQASGSRFLHSLLCLLLLLARLAQWPGQSHAAEINGNLNCPGSGSHIWFRRFPNCPLTLTLLQYRSTVISSLLSNASRHNGDNGAATNELPMRDVLLSDPVQSTTQNTSIHELPWLLDMMARCWLPSAMYANAAVFSHAADRLLLRAENVPNAPFITPYLTIKSVNNMRGAYVTQTIPPRSLLARFPFSMALSLEQFYKRGVGLWPSDLLNLGFHGSASFYPTSNLPHEEEIHAETNRINNQRDCKTPPCIPGPLLRKEMPPLVGANNSTGKLRNNTILAYALFLEQQMYGQIANYQSHWDTFFISLPTTFFSPQSLSDQERGLIARHFPVALEAFQKDVETSKSQFELLKRAVSNSFPTHPLPRYEEFLYYSQAISSRCWSDHFGGSILAPVQDMFNHDPAAPLIRTVSVQDEWFFEVYGPRDHAVPAGSEVFLSYGDHGDFAFISVYGFYPKVNPARTIDYHPVTLSKSNAALFERLCNQYKCADTSSLVILANGTPSPETLLWYRIQLLDGADLSSCAMQQALSGSASSKATDLRYQPVSPQNEFRVWDVLHVHVQSLLDWYGKGVARLHASTGDEGTKGSLDSPAARCDSGRASDAAWPPNYSRATSIFCMLVQLDADRLEIVREALRLAQQMKSLYRDAVPSAAPTPPQ